MLPCLRHGDLAQSIHIPNNTKSVSLVRSALNACQLFVRPAADDLPGPWLALDTSNGVQENFKTNANALTYAYVAICVVHRRRRVLTEPSSTQRVHTPVAIPTYLPIQPPT